MFKFNDRQLTGILSSIVSNAASNSSNVNRVICRLSMFERISLGSISTLNAPMLLKLTGNNSFNTLPKKARFKIDCNLHSSTLGCAFEKRYIYFCLKTRSTSRKRKIE